MDWLQPIMQVGSLLFGRALAMPLIAQDITKSR
jgi:hypothetical protein